MKKLSILLLAFTFIMMASPVFPASLQFDIYPAGGSGDGVWDKDYAVNPGDEIQVDVWLDEYYGLPITSLIYSFKWDNTHLKVIDSWAFDTDHGGVWSPSYSYSHFLSGGDYFYRASSGLWIEPGIPVNTNKIKLHTIVLENVTESTSKINTADPGFDEVMVEGGFSFSVNHAEAEIHPPAECEIAVEPETKIVSSGETVQFTANVIGDYCDDPCYTWEIVERESTGSIIDANGMYTAGSTGGTDKVKATDTCSGDESISAIANVTVIPCKVTIDPEGKTVLIDKTLQFSAISTGDCNPSCYTWEIVERESAGSTIGVNGMYTAGSAVGTDKVKVTDTCNGGISSETTVEVIPCKLTIDPPSITVPPGQAQEFTASLEGNCNEPCYTWSVSSEGTTENTTNNSASIYTWSMNADGATGDTGNTTNAYIYQAGPSEGKVTITVTDKCNSDLSETAEITIKVSPPPPPPPPPPSVECTSDEDCANDDLFCNGGVSCRRGICRSTSDPCQDDGLFCNGEESCDEENDECLPGEDPCSLGLCDEGNDVCVVEPLPECETDAECNDGLFCNGEETCNENGTCQSGNDPCADDGLFCTGVESCDEDSDVCISSGDPCTSPEVCDDNADVCAPPPAPPLLLDIIPNQALRSHLIPLPLFMFLTTSDEDTSFDLLATTVSSSSDAITPIWTFVLTEDLIFGFAFTTPAGLETTGSTNVEIAVTVNDRVGTATLILNMLPWILDEGNPM